MNILRPSLIALDSSHLGNLARDLASRDAGQQEAARAFLDSFSGSGGVLLLTWHHLEELLKHRGKTDIAARVAFLQSVPMLAWITPFADHGAPGSVVDILLHEVAAAFDRPDADALAIRGHVAKDLFRYGPGGTAVQAFLNDFDQIQPALWVREERNREIVAIARSNFTGISKTKVVEWLKGELRSAEDSQERLKALSGRLTADIQQRGDKRIPDAARTATAFMDEVREAGAALSRTANPAMQILAAQDIEPSDIGPETTMDEVGDLIVFRKRLRIVNERLGAPWSDVKARARQDRLPSCIIQCALRRYGQDVPERKGSELTDSCLATLAAYADITNVDKRTHENFRRACKKSPGCMALVRRVEKASGYQKIASQLAAKGPLS